MDKTIFNYDEMYNIIEDRDLYIELIGDFENEVSECLLKINNQLKTKSYDAIKKETHKIKGCAGYFCAKQLQNLADNITYSEYIDYNDIVKLNEIYGKTIILMKSYL